MRDDLPEGLRAFVNDDVALLPTGLSDGDRAHLVEVLLDRRDAARLDRLGDSSDKLLAKAARRALHVLRTRGAAPAERPKRVYRVEGPFAASGPPSWASIVDGMGERVVWYVEETDRGIAIYEAEISEGRGLLSLTAVEAPRKAWRERLQFMQRSERALIGEISSVHARVLIERAYRRTREVGRALPEEYTRHRRALQTRDELLEGEHPLRARLGRVTATDEEMTAILDRPELAMFMPPQATLEALDTAVGEVVTTEADLGVRATKLEAVIDRIADETLTAEVRARLADRLLELGLLTLSRQGDDDLAAARACLAAADRALADQPAHEHPTLRTMLKRLLSKAD